MHVYMHVYIYIYICIYKGLDGLPGGGSAATRAVR